MAGNWDQQLVKELWEQIDSGSRYDIKRSAQERLLAILPAFPAYLFERPAEQLNKLLRVELSPPLKARDERSLALASWIIRDWGGIKRGFPAIPQWMAALGDFDDKNVKMFIDNGVQRISAWSKLLAFADQENHAIYDARTSVALNCALRKLGDSRRFYMPDGQNDLIKEARLRLRRLGTESGEPTQPVGYLSYIELLRTVFACGLTTSVLAAEMVIYANAPNTAHQFLTCV